MHSTLIEKFDIQPAPATPIYAGRVCVSSPTDLRPFLFKAKIDRIDLWVRVDKGRKTPTTNWKELQKTIHSAIGVKPSVTSKLLRGETERSGCNFIVTLQDPDGPTLEAAQNAIRHDFGSDSTISIESMEIAVDVYSKSKNRKSQMLEQGFHFLSRDFVPIGNPLIWNARRCAKSGCETFGLSTDTLRYTKEWTRYFLNRNDPVFYKLYHKKFDGFTIKGDPSSARVLPEEEQCIRLEATFQNRAVESELGLVELDELLSNGLPPLKRFFRFMTPTPKDWRDEPKPLLRNIKAWRVFQEMKTYADMGVWRLALERVREDPALVMHKKLGLVSNKKLDKRVADALKGINAKSKIGKYLVK